MISGAPEQARWLRAEPRRTLPRATVDRMVDAALPGARVLSVEALDDGRRNANFRVRLDRAPGCIVLRIYEHDASLCRKEVDLLRFVSADVPVPEVIYSGDQADTPFAILRYVEGITFRELAHGRDARAIAEAAYSAGQTLAAIGRFEFAKPGWIAAGPTVTAPLLAGPDPIPGFIDLCRQSRRFPDALRQRVHEFVWRHAEQYAVLAARSNLVHGDFNRRNLIVRCISGRWTVVAVLDWEFAVSGSPLADMGAFLRYGQYHAHFSSGYLRGGGALTANWQSLASSLDLVALCESLTHEELPPDVERELLEFVAAAVERE